MTTRTLPSILLCLLIGATVQAQSGILDPDFGLNGVVNVSHPFNSMQGTTMVLRPNGNIILVGTLLPLSGEQNKQVACMELTSDGEVLNLDYFGADDRSDIANSVALQDDGKIVVAGSSAPLGDPFAEDILLFRVNTDWTLDTDFGNNGFVVTDFSQPGTPTREYANAVSILPNGRILIAGTGDESVFEKILLARYLPNGDLDASGFGTNGRTYATPSPGPAAALAMRVLNDGRLLIAGTSIDGVQLALLARFASNGTLDATFGNAGYANLNGFEGIAYSLDMQSNGNIVIGNVNENGGGMEMLRVSSEGAFDPTFGFLGLVSTFIFPQCCDSKPAVVLAQPDDRLVLVGTNENGQFRALRYTTNGNPDAAFGNAGSFTLPGNNSGAFCAALQPDGKLLLGGYGRVNNTRTLVVCRLLNELTVAVSDKEFVTPPILLYPNPTADETTFAFSLNRAEAVSMQLYDASGALVQTLLSEARFQAGDHTWMLDLSGLPAGSYMLTLTTGDRVLRAPIVRL